MKVLPEVVQYDQMYVMILYISNTALLINRAHVFYWVHWFAKATYLTF